MLSAEEGSAGWGKSAALTGRAKRAALMEEQAFVAERRLCGLRLLVVASGFLLFPLMARQTPAVHRVLAYVLLVGGAAYSVYLYAAEPYRRYPVLRSSVFITISDALFTTTWLYATGGVYSPFFVVLYVSMIALAFRFPVRASVFAAALYAASYLGLVLGLGQMPGHQAVMAVRLVYLLFSAALGAEVSRELLHRSAERVRGAELLAQAGASLASSLDYSATLNLVARLAVPELADLCIVDIVEKEREIRRVAVCAADPRLARMAELLKERFSPTWDSPQSSVRVMKSGQPELLVDIGPKEIEANAVSPEHARILRAFAARSKITVPMVARGRTIGAMILGVRTPERRYGPTELAFAEELARVAAMAVDNARLYHEAKEAVEVRDVFLSVASHELKTPLTSLQLQVQTLRRMAAHSPDHTMPCERVRTRAEVLERQVERLTMLVNHLLDASRLTRGELELDRAEVDLGNVAIEVVDRFREELSVQGSEAVLHRGGPAIIGCWDRLRLEQALSNLMANAIKYGAGQPIEIDVGRTGGAARLTVRDRGIGIAPADQGRIFGRFERAVSSKTYSGIGMGLWVTRRIIEAHGGHIEVSSQPGQGATFTVELPLG